MTTSSDEQSTDILLLANVLEKLRTRAGLTADRLRLDRTGLAAPLLDLVADVPDTDPVDAALSLVADCVLGELGGTHRIVADVVLALELHDDALAAAGIDDRIIRSLYRSALGRRRETLLNNWHALHAVLGQEATAAPSDRALRGSLEPAVLGELAGRLVRRAGSLTRSEHAIGTSPTGRVVVVGGAVMDARFHIAALPAPETSTEAYGFDLLPGGKALTQAVAAARLGLKTSLIAAVTDDPFGEEIMQHLENEGVDTSLVKRVRGRHAPFTGILERELGDSIAVSWRNQGEVVIEAKDIDERYDDLVACDALLMTFEVPREVMQHTLALVRSNPVSRPLVIVTPGQPYVDEKISRDAFPRIDYLVANPWELGSFAPQGLSPFDPDPVARSLLAFGLETLCLLVNGGCTVYSRASDQPVSVPSIPSIYKEASASRDAFCAALAARLIDNERKFTDGVARWAAAAMSCAAMDYPLPNPLPDRQRIDDLLARTHLAVSDPTDLTASGGQISQRRSRR
ncbi:PfkB family carbohydrate kinase [Kribbella sp. NPDC026611]|uniref:PfkB family carbohydrate kinase n=1 Tax=Kribbella sp. NPDC026611 TaxID=3154911 RepID=UPI0033DA8BF7